jgi:biopolymer transport protein ExbD
MAMTATAEADTPIGSLNTTPLIDIMLVLLVMFIITVPMQTHAVKVALPGPGPEFPDHVRPDFNVVSVDTRNNVTWNGAPVDLTTLRAYLDRSRTMPIEPELHVQPDPQARYARVDEMLAVVKRSNVTKVGFVDNERYAVFGK